MSEQIEVMEARIEQYGTFAADLSDDTIARLEGSLTDDEIKWMATWPAEEIADSVRDMEIESGELAWAERVKANDPRLSCVPVEALAVRLVYRAIVEN